MIYLNMESVITLPIILLYICLTCQDKSYPYTAKKREDVGILCSTEKLFLDNLNSYDQPMEQYQAQKYTVIRIDVMVVGFFGIK